MSALLELALLGPPQIRLDGQPLTEFKTLKAQALLFYLAVTGHHHSRSSLAGLLWAEMTETHARANLSKALSELRALVGEHVQIERLRVRFNNQSNYELDLRQLQAGLAELLDAQQAAAQPERLLAQCKESVALYRGDFLEGFYVREAPEFEMWMLAERGRQREQMVQSLHRLAEISLAAGRWHTGIEYARRLLEIEPWREVTHRQLMLLLARSGQRTAALAQFEACRHLLATELDVEPDADTLALVQQIRAGEVPQESQISQLLAQSRSIPPEQDSHHAITPSPPPSFLDAASEEPRRETEVFVARGRELHELQNHLQTALEGGGRVVFVTGEAGSGKSALLRTFAGRAMAAHPRLRVAQGICNAYTGTGDPYLPFREILGMLAGRVEERWTGGVLRRQHAVQLWRLLPTMVEILLEQGANLIDTMVEGRALMQRAATQGRVSPRQMERLHELVTRQHQPLEQDRLFQQVGAVLQTLARQYPLLLVLDDLHWADASSIALLFYLGRSLPHHPILVVCAYRPEDLAPTRKRHLHPVEEMLGEFQRRFGEIEVSLDDQAERDEQHFVHALLDSQPNKLDTEFRHALLASSRGHPLFTLEVLRDLQARAILVQDADGDWIQDGGVAWDALPARVEGIIERRIGRLEPALRTLLDLAAVEGEIFTAEVGAKVLNVDELQVIRHLTELEKTHRLVAPSGIERVGTQRLSQYRFRHNLFQHYLYTSLSAIERSYLHERAGQQLEELYGAETTAIAVQLGRHFQAAGQTDKAIRYWQQAGDTASRLHAHAEAIESYRRALALAKAGPFADLLQPLFTSLGRALELDARHDDALSLYQEMEALAETQGDRPLQLTALTAQAVLMVALTTARSAKEGEQLLVRALELAADLHDQAAEARILWVMLHLNAHSNRMAQALACGERALALARDLGLAELEASILLDLGSHIYEQQIKFEEGAQVLQEALTIWRRLDNQPMQTDTLSTLSEIAVQSGEYAKAIALSDEALAISQSIDNLWGQSYSQMMIGVAHWETGHIDRALATMQEALELAERSGFAVPLSITRPELARLYAELGAVEESLAQAQRAAQDAEQNASTLIAPSLGSLAYVHTLYGDVTSAETAIKNGKEHPSRKANPVWWGPVPLAEATLALRLQDYDRAVRAAQELLHLELGRYAPRAYLLMAQARLGLGQMEAASQRLQEAYTMAQTQGSRWMLWQILSAQSQNAAQPEQRKELQAQARDLLEAIMDTISTTELRVSLRMMPDVAQVLDCAGD